MDSNLIKDGIAYILIGIGLPISTFIFCEILSLIINRDLWEEAKKSPALYGPSIGSILYGLFHIFKYLFSK